MLSGKSYSSVKTPEHALRLVFWLVMRDDRIPATEKDDVAQEAAWKMIRNGGRTAAYAKKCIRSVWIDLLRYWQLHKISDEILFSQFEGTADHTGSHNVENWLGDLASTEWEYPKIKELEEFYAKARLSLPKYHRRYMDNRVAGLNQRELAKTLGITLSMVENYSYRICKIFRQYRDRLYKDVG